MDAVSQREPSRKERLLALIVFAVILISSLLTLTRFLEPHADEIAWASVFVNFVDSGHFSMGYLGDLYGFDQTAAGAGRMFVFGLGSFFWIFGPGW
jgi:hypothetical protein